MSKKIVAAAVAALERYVSFKLAMAADLAIVAALLLWWLA